MSATIKIEKHLAIALIDWDNCGPSIEAQAILWSRNIFVNSFGVSSSVNIGRVTPLPGSPTFVMPVTYEQMFQYLMQHYPSLVPRVQNTLALAATMKPAPQLFRQERRYYQYIIAVGHRVLRELRSLFRHSLKFHPPRKVTIFHIRRYNSGTVRTMCAIVMMLYNLDAREFTEGLRTSRWNWADDVDILNWTY